MDGNNIDHTPSQALNKPGDLLELDIENIHKTTDGMDLFSFNSNLTNLSQTNLRGNGRDSDDDSSEYDGSDVTSLTTEPGFNSPKPVKHVSSSVYGSEIHSLTSDPDFNSLTPLHIQDKSLAQNPEFSWAFFNCPATFQIAGLLLFVGGLVTLTTGVVLTAAATATAGAVIAGVGALLGLYGFYKPELIERPEHGVDNTLSNIVLK